MWRFRDKSSYRKGKEKKSVAKGNRKSWDGDDRGAPKALMVGDEYTTVLISFLIGGYYLMPEVLLVFVLFRRLMSDATQLYRI